MGHAYRKHLPTPAMQPRMGEKTDTQWQHSFVQGHWTNSYWFEKCPRVFGVSAVQAGPDFLKFLQKAHNNNINYTEKPVVESNAATYTGFTLL